MRPLRRFAAVAIAVAAVLPAAPAAAAMSDNVKEVAHFEYTGGTDIDFSDGFVYAGQQGNEGGIHVIDARGRKPKEIAFIVCPGSQNDVAMVKPGLLALGYHSGQCGATPGAGVRLIDVRNPKRPKYLSDVSLPGGTHTLTVYPGKPIIYASPGGLRNGAAIEQILDASNPDKLEVAATFTPNAAGCHDLSFFVKKDTKLAFCPGLTEIQIWDVSDPLAPQTIGHIVNPFMFFPHSAIATYDGKYLVVGDEAFGAHDCAGGVTGSLYVYDITNPMVPLLMGHFGPPRGAALVGGVTPWCTAHNYNFIPGTYTLVSSWYTGGTSVIDLSNPLMPQEIAYFQPDDADTWSSYWYEGYIYANDLNRGLDVLKVKGLNEPKRKAG